MNKVEIQGRLGKDPELKYVGSGNTPLCKFSVATTEEYESGGEIKKITEWFNCVAWGPRGETIAELKKGDEVFAMGHMQTRKWEREGKETKYFTELNVRFCKPDILATSKPAAGKTETSEKDDDVPF